jgi:hypothetical protein
VRADEAQTVPVSHSLALRIAGVGYFHRSLPDGVGWTQLLPEVTGYLPLSIRNRFRQSPGLCQLPAA